MSFPNACILSFLFTLQILTNLSAAGSGGGFSLPLVARHHGLNYSADGFFSYVQQQHLPPEAANLATTTIRPAMGPYAWSYGVQVGVGSGRSQHFHLLELDITGELTWMQCAPSVPELPQASPIFDTRGSSSYEYIGKYNHLCAAPYTRAEPNRCAFHVTAQSASASANGYLGRDDFIFTSSLGGNNNLQTIKRIVFGCAHKTEGFQNHGALAGVLSLSRHRSSLMRQLKNLGVGQFSYCLGGNGPSFLRFGDDIPYPSNMRHTKVMYPREQTNEYRLHVVGVVLDGRRLFRITANMFLRSGHVAGDAPSGGCTVDVAAPVSRMIRAAYDILEREVAAHLRSHGAHGITVPGHGLCVLDTQENRAHLPGMALELYGGTHFDIEPELLFVAVSYGSAQYLCFTVTPDEHQTVLGAMHQLKTQFVFDLISNEISFAPAQC